MSKTEYYKKRSLPLTGGWEVLQDVHDLGERFALFDPDFDASRCPAGISSWEPVDRLDYLQLLLSDSPYFGRELRYMNHAPWWYRKCFTLEDFNQFDRAYLHVYGADYFSKFWLNGRYLGEHEGYFDSFSFDISSFLLSGREQVLTVKVYSPWDRDVLGDMQDLRFTTVVRNLVKGTYEHADTFIQRDVNPVGLWGDVSVEFSRRGRIASNPLVESIPAADHSSASVSVISNIELFGESECSSLNVSIIDPDGVRILWQELPPEEGAVVVDFHIERPRFWYVWERGRPDLYTVVIELFDSKGSIDRKAVRFGIREIQLLRDEKRTVFFLNGQAIFIRGTSYFPEIYLSLMSRQRYYRDLVLMKEAGFNTVRVHVHVEKSDFYELCDEMGMLVIQDSDLNWTHPSDASFNDRAERVFSNMVKMLRSHPSIISWVCVNEPDLWKLIKPEEVKKEGSSFYDVLSERLVKALKDLDPQRPYIKGSFLESDPESGDSHTYLGSINGPDSHYTDIYGSGEKLNTEFGIDAPPVEESLKRYPKLLERLGLEPREIDTIQEYQSRLIQYYIEYYRIRKYRPTSGYVQFMFIDLCPQSFMGIYDWWGVPKRVLQCIEQINKPVGVFLEHTDIPLGLWVVNDTTEDIGEGTVSWLVINHRGDVLESGVFEFSVKPDSSLRLCEGDFMKSRGACKISLKLFRGEDLLAENHYENPFSHPRRRAGHPKRIDHEIGMRLF